MSRLYLKIVLKGYFACTSVERLTVSTFGFVFSIFTEGVWAFSEICGAMINATIDVSLIKMFIEGPEVSLNGSPTVSPVTDALCGSDFL